MEDDLGTAKIVYDDPDEGTVEREIENENIAYFQDHWILKVDEDDGKDVVRRIPVERVHYVERSVETFEDEVSTLKSQVESFAGDVRDTIFGGRTQTSESSDVTRIDVESGDETDR
ncbi:hypothetical protein U3A55_00730 [Salarchaeum sp. III]|uniref:hypothetical protein n=1 Tax=Salarchaeum sp. III TaxID=3107927 RepID=UPI002ED77673